MASQITNKSGSVVLVRLRSGATVHLAAGEQSAELDDVDVRNNPRIESLVQRNLVTVVDTSPPEKKSTSATKRPRTGSRSSGSGDDKLDSQ
jgi:hypothetical protein